MKNLIELAKNEIKISRNLKDSKIELLRDCATNGYGEDVLILDYDQEEDLNYYGEYIIFGDTTKPYINITSYSDSIRGVVNYIDNEIDRYNNNNQLLLTMEDVSESEDLTFYCWKGDFGNIAVKYKDTMVSLGIYPESKEFYLKDVNLFKTFTPPYSYEGLPDEEDDWKYAVYFSKYTQENVFNTESFVEHIINLFLSECDNSKWQSFLPKNCVSSSNFITDNVSLTFRDKNNMLTSLNKLFEELENMSYNGEEDIYD